MRQAVCQTASSLISSKLKAAMPMKEVRRLSADRQATMPGNAAGLLQNIQALSTVTFVLWRMHL
jgi:hypothetical protein